jgi:hypothetical protein
VGAAVHAVGAQWRLAKRRARALRSWKPDSGHADTISLTIHLRRASRNVMKPRIQCVLTHWIPGFIASGAWEHGSTGGWGAGGSGRGRVGARERYSRWLAGAITAALCPLS